MMVINLTCFESHIKLGTFPKPPFVFDSKISFFIWLHLKLSEMGEYACDDDAPAQRTAN